MFLQRLQIAMPPLQVQVQCCALNFTTHFTIRRWSKSFIVLAILYHFFMFQFPLIKIGFFHGYRGQRVPNYYGQKYYTFYEKELQQAKEVCAVVNLISVILLINWIVSVSHME